ncbi:yippee-domain-containing protein [Cystobasidium minutum MCA 4210]|uniref:yippee-domain-containing protein n=1 Tax=Cystobasidium minutum MCA 4210 TaxID=1397322 RepID=UPI0034CE40EE|eukprot:jgi/Rhomi1/45248/CE45247_1053
MAASSPVSSPTQERYTREEGNSSSEVEPAVQLEWLDRPKYVCATCGCDLALQDELVSRAFSGRAGPAFLLRSAVNVKLAKSEQKMLLSGMHTISNITCKGCDTPLGWVYLKANDPAQRYKEGKYIMEKEKIMKENNWAPGKVSS